MRQRSQTFTIDQWSNLYAATATGNAPPLNLAVNANNHISTAPFAYDAAGNTCRWRRGCPIDR